MSTCRNLPGSTGSPDPTRTAGIGAWIRSHPYTVAFLLFAVIMFWRVKRPPLTEFEWVFVNSARNLVEGRGLYLLKVPPFRAYTYPPWMAVMALPFAYIPRASERVVWFLIQIACLTVLWRGSWRLSGGGALEGRGVRVPRSEHLIACLGLACALHYVESDLRQPQTDLVIAALLTGGCLALSRSRTLVGAILFGLAAAMKCTPLLFAPYLALRGHWRAAVLVVAVAVGMNLVPDLVHPPAEGGSWLIAWIHQFLQPMAQPGYLPGRWYSRILDNQSIAGAFTRWASTRLAWQNGEIVAVNRSSTPDAHLLRIMTYSCELTLLALAAYTMRRRWRAAPSNANVSRAPEDMAAEWGAVMALMLLLSPMTSRTHFVVLLLPALCVARRAFEHGDRVARWLIYLTLATAVLEPPVWGHTSVHIAMWCGLSSWGTAFLLAGCLWILWNRSPVADGAQRSVAGWLQAPHILQRRTQAAKAHRETSREP